MAKELDEKKEGAAPAVAANPKGALIKKAVMFGVPIFLVQLVLVYFVITKFIAPSGGTAPVAAQEKATEKSGEEEKGGGEGKEGGEATMYVVKDVIVNPAGTNGTRFLLTTVGFEVTSAACKSEMERKDVQVRDVLNTVLTSKRLDELSDIQNREALRTELSEKMSDLLKTGSITNVYFSKFIIQ